MCIRDRSSGWMIPSGCESSAASRWPASTCAWPAAAALWIAVLIASWLRVVNFDASMLMLPLDASSAPHGHLLAGRPDRGEVLGVLERVLEGVLRDGELPLELGRPDPQRVDLVLQ